MMKRTEMHDEYDYSHTHSSEGDESKKPKVSIAHRTERGCVQQTASQSHVVLFTHIAYMQHNRRVGLLSSVETDESSYNADFSYQ